MKAVVLFPMASMNGLISLAPRAQFSPILQTETERSGRGPADCGDGDPAAGDTEQRDSPQRVGVGHADDEGLPRLTRKSSSTSVYDGPRDLDRENPIQTFSRSLAIHLV